MPVPVPLLSTATFEPSAAAVVGNSVGVNRVYPFSSGTVRRYC